MKRMARFIISTTLFALSVGQAFAQGSAPSWTYTGSLSTPRAGHTATLLPNGKVLVVGGSGAAGEPDTADLYDPATGTWSFTGNLNATGSSARPYCLAAKCWSPGAAPQSFTMRRLEPSGSPVT